MIFFARLTLLVACLQDQECDFYSIMMKGKSSTTSLLQSPSLVESPSSVELYTDMGILTRQERDHEADHSKVVAFPALAVKEMLRWYHCGHWARQLQTSFVRIDSALNTPLALGIVYTLGLLGYGYTTSLARCEIARDEPVRVTDQEI